MYGTYLEATIGMAREAGAIQPAAFRSGDLGADTKSNLSDAATHLV